MDAGMILRTATVLLGVTALGGLVMAVMRFAGAERPPSWLAMLHGLLAGSGLTLLLYAGFSAGMPTNAWLGTGLLVLAALGGVFLNLTYHDKRLPLPISIVLIHALLAVTGFVLIFLAAFR